MTDERPAESPSLEDLTPLLRINRLCDEFRRAWKGGDAPDIENYLAQVSESTRESLLRNLLPIDIEARRRRTNESPSSDDYIKRFPEHARLIRQAFFESTMASLHHEVSTPAVAATISLVPVAQRLGDYELLGELGKGGFGVVYEARHVKRGDRVALKTLPLEAESRETPTPGTEERKRKAGDRMLRFKREFRMLADMNHPNLVGLHSLEADGDQMFFTMDLIEGTDFIDFVRPGGRLDEGRLRSALPQLVAGVMALHSRNVIHRDLKPSNLMVSNDGRVTILDFGLVSELEKSSESVSSAGFVGTPEYAAPEQIQGQHTSASDWYSVGTILYESLAGTRPYPGHGIGVLNKKQSDDPAPFHEEDGLPTDLTNLAMSLVNRDPARRPDALEVTHFVSGELATETASTETTSGALIGRDDHLRQLQNALDEVQQHKRAHCVFVSGRSGEGKTSLVEHFLEPFRQSRDYVVLSGRCYDRESMPFKAIDGIIDSLVSFLQRLPDAEAALLLPDDVAFLIQLFPVLQRVEMIARRAKSEIARMDRAQVLHRGFVALRLLLSRISEHRTVVLFSDDLQWGDSDSAAGVLKVIGGDESPRALFIGTFRSDEVSESSFLSQWDSARSTSSFEKPVERIGLAPLSEHECFQLMVDRLDRSDDLIQRRSAEFFAKTGGNPYLLVELIGCFDPDSDSFESLALSEVIARKLARLEDEACTLLETVSAAGKAISLREVFLAMGHQEINIALINHMRSENLVRLVGATETGQVDTYHDKIRETMLGETSNHHVAEIRLRLARSIEENEGIDRERVLGTVLRSEDYDLPAAVDIRAGELARHYQAGGDEKCALSYAVLAAEAAVRQFALPIASEYYEMASRYMGDAERKVCYRLAEGYGDCLRRVGESEKALKMLATAVDLSDEELQIARIEYLRAETLFQSNDLVGSIECFTKAMRILGIPFPTTRVRLFWSLLKERFVFEFNDRFVSGRKLSKKELSPQLALSVTILIQSNKPLLWRDMDRFAYVNIKAVNLTRGLEHPTFKLINIVGQLSTIAYLYGEAGIKRDILNMNIQPSSTNDSLLYAFTIRCGGYINEHLGRLAEAKDLYDYAEESLTSRVQDQYQLNSVHWWQANVLLGLGRIRESAEIAESTYRDAVTSGMGRIAANVLQVWIRAACGKLPFDALRSCFTFDQQDTSACIAIKVAESEWHLSFGRYEAALEAARNAYDQFAKAKTLVNIATAQAPHALMKCLNRSAEQALTIDAGRSTRLYAAASKLATKRRLRVINRISRCSLPAIYRERAVAINGLGKTRRALSDAELSCKIAEQQGAVYELAQSRLIVAKLSRELNLPDADRLLSDAMSGLAPFEQMIEANAAKWQEKPLPDVE